MKFLYLISFKGIMSLVMLGLGACLVKVMRTKRLSAR